MADYPSPATAASLKDEEIQMLIDWLSTKDTLGKQGINLAVTVVEGLMADRRLLVQALESIQEVSQNV